MKFLEKTWILSSIQFYPTETEDPVQTSSSQAVCKPRESIVSNPSSERMGAGIIKRVGERVWVPCKQGAHGCARTRRRGDHGNKLAGVGFHFPARCWSDGGEDVRDQRKLEDDFQLNQYWNAAFNRGQFWEWLMLKWSRELHMTDFPSTQTGKWMEGITCHKLASSGGSSLNYSTLEDILP